MPTRNKLRGAINVAFGSRFPLICARQSLPASGKLHTNAQTNRSKHHKSIYHHNPDSGAHHLQTAIEEIDHQEVVDLLKA